MKFELVEFIACALSHLHRDGLIHGNIHGTNIIIDGDIPTFCNIRRLVQSTSISSIQGVLPFIAPEIFHTRKFTKESDVYAFGIIMHLVATGEPPFRNREFDANLICDILHGLRPAMPDSATKEYKKIAEMCCDADPNKRPDIEEVLGLIVKAPDNCRTGFAFL